MVGCHLVGLGMWIATWWDYRAAGVPHGWTGQLWYHMAGLGRCRATWWDWVGGVGHGGAGQDLANATRQGRGQHS